MKDKQGEIAMQDFRLLNKPVMLVVTVFMTVVNTTSAESQIVRPFESNGKQTVTSDIDKLVIATLHENGIEPANMCSDEVFVRRLPRDCGLRSRFRRF